MSVISLGTKIVDLRRGIGSGTGSGGSSFSSSKSLDFDGGDDYIAIGSYTALDATQTFSISMWIKLPRGGGGYVVGKNNTASYWGRRFTYYITESTIEINTSSLAFRNQSLSLATDTWMHIAMVIDRGEAVQLDRCKIYQNGAPVTNVANSNFAQVAADASPLILGARQIGTTSPVINSPFEGNIDEISIWSNALTSNDVSDIWDNGVPNDLTGETGLINWWRMGENSTFSSQILMPENTNKDKFSNYSMEFDGGTDYISITETVGTSDFSISLWVKSDYKNGYFNILGGTGLFQYICQAGWHLRFHSGGWKTLVSNCFDGNWHHISVTFDSSTSDIKSYKDGVLDSTWNIPLFNNLNNKFQNIGSYLGGGIRFYPGILDELSLYNTTLDSTEITNLWHLGKPTDLTGQSGLVSWWRMGEESTYNVSPFPDGTWTIPDQIGGNDGTSANMDIYTRIGNAPNSENNALSYNMDAFDIVSDTP